MRHKFYFRQLVELVDEHIDACPFQTEDYREAGAPVTPEYGMYDSTATALMNKWNREYPAFKFWVGSFSR